MTITARVHVDLSAAADNWELLFIGEQEHRQLWQAIGDTGPYPAVRITIGSAAKVYFHDKRALLLLAALDSLIVEGSDARGVQSAVDAIQECREGMDAASAGRSAS